MQGSPMWSAIAMNTYIGYVFIGYRLSSRHTDFALVVVDGENTARIRPGCSSKSHKTGTLDNLYHTLISLILTTMPLGISKRSASEVTPQS